MADFSFLSDSEDEKAVEELLSQAAELSALEQVAAINCSGFTDSVLPTHLETRFQKLKSFPSAPSKRKSSNRCKSDGSFRFKESDKDKSELNSASDEDVEAGSERKGFGVDLESSPGEKKGLKGNSKCSKSLSFSSKDEKFSRSKNSLDGERGLTENPVLGLSSSPLKSLDFSPEREDFSSFKSTRDKKKGGKLKIPDGKAGREFKSPSGSFSCPSDSSSEPFSPPPRSGCLWCSPKKVPLSRRKSKENRASKIGHNWGKNDELLSDLSTFSEKNQQKLMKKVMEEEEKISREAEKIVKWAKQASARMEVSGVEDELSDDGSFKSS